MICAVNKNGWVTYPYQNVRKFFPFTFDWKVRERPHSLSCVMRYCLSRDLLAVRLYITKGENGDGLQIIHAHVEYKERGLGEWSKWTTNSFSVPQKSVRVDVHEDMSFYLEEARVDVEEDISHLLTFYGATFAGES